jgi:hypothetical protein
MIEEQNRGRAKWVAEQRKEQTILDKVSRVKSTCCLLFCLFLFLLSVVGLCFFFLTSDFFSHM